MSATIERGAAGLAVTGAMTLETASALLAQGNAALADGEALIDLAAVTAIDSSGLAVLFGWQRAAQARGKTLRIANLPANLLSLAGVYGVAELLPSS